MVAREGRRRCGRRCARAGRSRGAGSSPASPGRPIRDSEGAGRSTVTNRSRQRAWPRRSEAMRGPRDNCQPSHRDIMYDCARKRPPGSQGPRGPRGPGVQEVREVQEVRTRGPLGPSDRWTSGAVGESWSRGFRRIRRLAGRWACRRSSPPFPSWCCSSCWACCARPPGCRRRRRWSRRSSSRSPSTACRVQLAVISALYGAAQGVFPIAWIVFARSCCIASPSIPASSRSSRTRSAG